MKSKQTRNTVHVPTDQPYIEGINLVTGDKFNYDRPILTEREINQLCISQKSTHLEKFIKIVRDGERIQKWSVFENLSLYARTSSDFYKMLEEIYKNYTQLTQFLSILGQGLANTLSQSTCTKQLTKQAFDLIFQLTYRTITQNPSQVQDWSKVLQKLSKHPLMVQPPRSPPQPIPSSSSMMTNSSLIVTPSSAPTYVEKCVNFINSSFSMNAPPNNRRVAFCMIRHLMDCSEQVFKLALSKVMFFNGDQNPRTRNQICWVLKKIVQEASYGKKNIKESKENKNLNDKSKNKDKDDQFWKAIVQYFTDKDAGVRDVAASTMCNIYHPANFHILIQSLSEQKAENEVSKYLSSFIVSFKELIQKEQRPKNQIFSFINRTIKSKKVQQIAHILNSLTSQVLQILGQDSIFQDIPFVQLPLNSPQPQPLQSLLPLYHRLQGQHNRFTIKSLILKSLKQTQYSYKGNCLMLAHILDLTQQQQIGVYLALCSKLLDQSKWYQIAHMLEVFQNMQMSQPLYERVSAFLLRLWMAAPVFLINAVVKEIVFLVIVNRRNLEFLITIREKMLNAKFWSHRKSYIILYAAFKQYTSFQCHKFIPTLVYKNVAADKSFGVRMAFAELAPRIYKYTDPSFLTQKSQIKESLQKLLEDKDQYIGQASQQSLAQIAQLDKNSLWLTQLYDHNRNMLQKQQGMVQVQAQQKKIIKTQNQISKSTAKSKRRIGTDQQRKTINVGKVQMHKDMSIDSILINGKDKDNKEAKQKQMGITSIRNNIIPATNVIPKKNNLFRCHSVKIKVPNKKT